jgi:hypothetical protein
MVKSLEYLLQHFGFLLQHGANGQKKDYSYTLIHDDDLNCEIELQFLPHIFGHYSPSYDKIQLKEEDSRGEKTRNRDERQQNSENQVSSSSVCVCKRIFRRR